MKLSNYVLDLRQRHLTQEGRKVDGLVNKNERVDYELSLWQELEATLDFADPVPKRRWFKKLTNK